jgi:hypothetical protein
LSIELQVLWFFEIFNNFEMNFDITFWYLTKWLEVPLTSIFFSDFEGKIYYLMARNFITQ